jgi:hypothetical protein
VLTLPIEAAESLTRPFIRQITVLPVAALRHVISDVASASKSLATLETAS